LTGATIVREEMVFAIRLPHDARITRVRFSRLTRSLEPTPRNTSSPSPQLHVGEAATLETSELPEDALETLGELSLELPR